MGLLQLFGFRPAPSPAASSTPAAQNAAAPADASEVKATPAAVNDKDTFENPDEHACIDGGCFPDTFGDTGSGGGGSLGIDPTNK